jgi:hypothetical protein
MSEESSSSQTGCQGSMDSNKKCKLKVAYIHLSSELYFCRKHLLEKINQDQPDTPVESLVK